MRPYTSGWGVLVVGGAAAAVIIVFAAVRMRAARRRAAQRLERIANAAAEGLAQLSRWVPAEHICVCVCVRLPRRVCLVDMPDSHTPIRAGSSCLCALYVARVWCVSESLKSFLSLMRPWRGVWECPACCNCVAPLSAGEP
eukprot:1185266-Prorocentrum_minimum.AAC.4